MVVLAVQNVPKYQNLHRCMPVNVVALVIITNLTDIIRATVIIVCMLSRNILTIV